MTDRQTAQNFFTRTRTLLLRPVQGALSVSWFWFAWQSFFALCLVYLSAHLPPPGIAIGVLGLLAVVATFERDPSSLQRSLWIIVATGLLIIEYGAIANDRSENQSAQEEVRATDQFRFWRTSTALQTAIQTEKLQMIREQSQFRDTIAHFEEVVNTETGGNTFCYLLFEEIYNRQSFNVTAVKVGKYPLKDVWAFIDDSTNLSTRLAGAFPQTTSMQARKEAGRIIEGAMAASPARIPIGNFATDHKILAPYPITKPQADSQLYTISLGANNGNWMETIVMKRVAGPYPGSHSTDHWAKEITVTRTDVNKRIFYKVDPDFPVPLAVQRQPRR